MLLVYLQERFCKEVTLKLGTCFNFQRKFHGKKHPKRTDSETATALSPLCSALLHERVFQAAGPLPLPFPLRLPPAFSPAEHKSHKPNFAFTTYSTYQSVGGTEREREPRHHATRGQDRAPSLRGKRGCGVTTLKTPLRQPPLQDKVAPCTRENVRGMRVPHRHPG